jgi:hypothetical protein
MLLLLAPHPPAGGAIFTVPAMAQLLFNRSDAAACAAALRMLRDDRLYFKQVLWAAPPAALPLAPATALPALPPLQPV